MKRIAGFALASLLLVVLTGCGAGPKSGKGFTLPDGDVARGQEVFVTTQCHACHTVHDVTLPALDPAPEPDINVALGGKVARIQTYGELVTSIINPSHRLAKGFRQEDPAPESTETPDVDDAPDVTASVETTAPDKKPESPMRNYNDVMTVSQLIDLVAFLQSHYELIEYEPSDYPEYY